MLFTSDEDGAGVGSVTDTGIDVDFIAPVEALDRIKNGMTFDEIVEILGRPLLNPYSGRPDGMLWRIGDKDSFILLHFDEGFSGQPVYRQSGNDFSDIKDSVSGTTAPEETEEPQTDGPQSEISEPMTEPVTEPWTEDPSETTAPVPTCDDESYILFFEKNKKAMTMLIAGDDMEEIYALAEPMSSEREAVLRRYITGVPEEDWELIPDDFGGFGSALTMFRIDGVWYWAEWSEGYAVEVGEDYWWKRILYFGAVQTPDDMNSELRRALRPD